MNEHIDINMWSNIGNGIGIRESVCGGHRFLLFGASTQLKI